MQPASAIPRTARILATVLLVAATAWPARPARAEQTVDPLRDAKVKAAYLYNFVKLELVGWPAEAFAKPDAPVVIGVLGEDPFGPVLDRTLKNKGAGDRAISIRRIPSPDDKNALDADAIRGLRSCHLLYISTSEEKRLPAILDAVKRSPVLTVSDLRSFARKRGMIEFVLKEERVGLEVNPQEAQAAGLRMHSRLLNLATIVKSGES